VVPQVREDTLTMMAVLAVVLDELPVLVLTDSLGSDECHSDLLSGGD
jgi:hypothetical protein